MVRQCYKCKKLDFLNRDLTFYRFPKELEKKKTWIAILALGKDTVPKFSYVCSDHFRKEDITYNLHGLCILKNDIVPKSSSDIEDKSLQKQFSDSTIKTEVKTEVETSAYNQHMVDIRLFNEDPLRNDKICNKEEEKKRNEKSSDTSSANQIDAQVKVEAVEVADKFGKLYERILQSGPVKRDEITVKEEPVEDTENSSSRFAGKIKEEDGKNKQSQLPFKFVTKRRHPIYKCIKCNYETTHKHRFYSHLRSHARRYKYKCKLCEYNTIYKSDLDLHVRSHTYFQIQQKSKKYKFRPIAPKSSLVFVGFS